MAIYIVEFAIEVEEEEAANVDGHSIPPQEAWSKADKIAKGRDYNLIGPIGVELSTDELYKKILEAMTHRPEGTVPNTWDPEEHKV